MYFLHSVYNIHGDTSPCDQGPCFIKQALRQSEQHQKSSWWKTPRLSDKANTVTYNLYHRQTKAAQPDQDAVLCRKNLRCINKQQ